MLKQRNQKRTVKFIKNKNSIYLPIDNFYDNTTSIFDLYIVVGETIHRFSSNFVEKVEIDLKRISKWGCVCFYKTNQNNISLKFDNSKHNRLKKILRLFIS